MTNLPERITIQRYYWDGERHQGTILAYDGEKGFAGIVYRREHTCEWRIIPEDDSLFEGVELIRSINHTPNITEEPSVVKYCPVCGGLIVVKNK